MEENQIEELAAAYALGSLDETERAEVERRLAAGEVALQKAVATYSGTTSQLFFAAEPRPPRAGVKEALMSKINAAATPAPNEGINPFFFLRAQEGEWQTTTEGISKKILFEDRTLKRTTMLLRMEPGSCFPEHSHDGAEELYVLEGHCICAGQLIGPGDFHRAEAHSDHVPTTTKNGCLMLVISPRIAASE